ncbi:SRPBCC family protein [Pseudarthrobacter sp. PvP090]|uniref:SRPBCC family protein n=1 Tax=Pseudarthrobacter sp. PvP090 TaxID=3156393 RepID=UPI00339A90A5
MKSFDPETLILAGAGTVWGIITDGGNYAVWDSGIAEVKGEFSHGERVRLRTRAAGKRTFRVRVSLVPSRGMSLSYGLPAGLLKVVRTFALTDYTGMTLLRVTDTVCGPLGDLVGKTLPGTDLALTGFLDAVKFRAELLSFHFEGGVLPGPAEPAAPDAGTRRPQLTGRHAVSHPACERRRERINHPQGC